MKSPKKMDLRFSSSCGTSMVSHDFQNHVLRTRVVRKSVDQTPLGRALGCSSHPEAVDLGRAGNARRFHLGDQLPSQGFQMAGQQIKPIYSQLGFRGDVWLFWSRLCWKTKELIRIQKNSELLLENTWKI